MTVRLLIVAGFVLATFQMMVRTDEAAAATLTVPGDHATIASALEAAAAGDRVEVSPGTYGEFDLALPNGVALVGASGDPADVVIDGQGRGRILLAERLDSSTLVAGLTFRGGHAIGRTSYERSGGAIYCNNSAIRITNCVFVENVSDGHGGAIRCTNADPEITGSIFRNNSAADGGGGAIDISFNSAPLIRGCGFDGNEAAWGGALSCRGYSAPQVIASEFEGNAAVGAKAYGGAVFADFGSTPSFEQVTAFGNMARYGGAFACLGRAATNLTHCTLTGNQAEVLGGGVFTYGGSPAITGSIIAFQDGTGISAEGGATPLITCSNIYGNTQGDWIGSISAQLTVGENIAADPLFCGTATGAAAYTLEEGSPAADPDLSCGAMGAWPVGCAALLPTVSSLAATWQNQQVQIAWRAQFSGTMPAFRLTGFRVDDPATTWDVAIQDLGGGFFEAVDPIQGGADEYGYRLYVAAGADTWQLVDEVQLATVPQFTGIRDLTAFPNPFNPMTTISFRLGEAQTARVSVYAPDGRRVAILADRAFEAGPQDLTWDGSDENGLRLGSGLYIVLVEGRVDRLTRKITLLK